MGNEVPLKHFGMGYVKVHGLYGNPLYGFREMGVGLQIQLYLDYTYPSALNLVKA